MPPSGVPLFLFAYVGMIVPVLGIVAASRPSSSPRPTAMYWFTGLLIALLAVIATLQLSTRRRPSGGCLPPAVGPGFRSGILQHQGRDRRDSAAARSDADGARQQGKGRSPSAKSRLHTWPE